MTTSERVDLSYDIVIFYGEKFPKPQGEWTHDKRTTGKINVIKYCDAEYKVLRFSVDAIEYVCEENKEVGGKNNVIRYIKNDPEGPEYYCQWTELTDDEVIDIYNRSIEKIIPSNLSKIWFTGRKDPIIVHLGCVIVDQYEDIQKVKPYVDGRKVYIKNPGFVPGVELIV